MAGGLHRASRLAGRLVALAAVVHSVVIVLLAGVGLGMEPVAAPDPTLALLAAIAQIVIGVLPGTAGPNKYGPDPKGPAAAAADVFV